MAVQLVLARIDDRLIHGQVVIGWVKATSPQHIIVASDAVAKDAIQKSLMEMAVPPQLDVTICPVSEVVEVCNQEALANKRVLLLFASSQDVLKAAAAGLPLKELNIGGLRFVPGKRQIMKAVAINDQELEDFRQLVKQGIHVVIQMVPTDEQVDIRKYL